jgi:hypothetical protein
MKARNAPISNNFSSQEFRTLKGFWTGMKIIFKSTILDLKIIFMPVQKPLRVLNSWLEKLLLIGAFLAHVCYSRAFGLA